MNVELLLELTEKYQDWLDTADRDDWTTRNLCEEVLEDLHELRMHG